MKIKFQLFAMLFVSVSLMADANHAGLSAQDKAAIYAVVIQRLLGPDDTYGSSTPIPPGKVYIETLLPSPPSERDIKQIEELYRQEDEFLKNHPKGIPPNPPPPPSGGGDGYLGGVAPPPVVMAADTEAALKKQLHMPQYDIHWISGGSHTLRFEPKTGAIVGGGTVLTLSQIRYLSADKLYVQGRIYQASLVSGITWYIFEKDASGWHLSRKLDGPVS